MRGRGVWWGPGSVVYPWVACRLVNVGRTDGDEAGVPVGREGCGWSWGGCGCGRALVSSLSLSPLTPAWFPAHVACDVHINLANAEVGSLESQRLWRLMKAGHGKLRATFLGSVVCVA